MGLAKEGTVTDAGVAHRQALEDKLDQLAASAWQHLEKPKQALC